MSRRKQSRPRSVKVVNDEDDFTISLGVPFDESSSSNNNRSNHPDTSDKNNNNNNDDNESKRTDLSGADNLVIAMSPTPAADDSDVISGRPTFQASENRATRQKRDATAAAWPTPTVSIERIKLSNQHAQKQPAAHIPPNFLLPPSSPSSSSPATSSSLFPAPFLPPPPLLTGNPFALPPPPPPLPSPSSSSSSSSASSSSSSSSSQSALLHDMARRKKSPKSISPWRVHQLPHNNHQDDSNDSSSNNSSATTATTTKVQKCKVCSVAPADGPPVEGHEYFIDSDGTLTIKNGVCPRSLAFMLFSDVSAKRGRYEEHLGENLVKFVLNLKQIVDKHRYACPAESPAQWATAHTVLKDYAHGSALQLLSPATPPPPYPIGGVTPTGNSHSRKRHHPDEDGLLVRISATNRRLSELYPSDDGDDGAGQDDPPPAHASRVRGGERAGLPDNFLVEPLPTPSPSPSHSPTPGHRPAQSSRKDKRSPDSGLALTPSGSERDPREGASDSGSVGGASSRVTSPAPSVSSVTSSLSLTEAAKQMANTKRGSKILPIASGDGGTRYLCPVCALELPNDHDLTVHIRSHNTQGVSGQVALPNSCTICGKTLSSQSSLDRHMLVHSGERPFKCKICDMSFTTNGNMHRHARIHEKNGTSVPRPAGRKSSASASSTSSSSAAAASASGGTASSTTHPSSSSSSTASSKAGRSKKESLHRQGGDVYSAKGVRPAPSPAFPPLMAEFGSNKLDLFKTQHDQSALLQQYYNDMNARMGQLMFPFRSSHHQHHPAFPYQHLLSDPGHLHYLPTMLNPITEEVLAKRARFSSPGHAHSLMAAAAASHAPLAHLVREYEREASPDLRTQCNHSCQLCLQVFASQWSLDAHMETHVIVDEQLEAESGCAVCKICKTVAKSEESLLLHTLTHHPPTGDSEPVHSGKTTPRKSPSPKSSPSSSPRQTEPTTSTSPKTNSAAAASPANKATGSSSSSSKTDNNGNGNQGFQSLNFACFTSKKFPLIAKVFCEEREACTRSSRLPVYPCSHCSLEFPVEGARDLHEVSHLPEEYTSCPTCNCHFSSSSQLQVHMHKHVSDLRFEESRCADGDEDEERPALSQGHFLAQFGLVAKDTESLSTSMLEELSNMYTDKLDHKSEIGANDSEVRKDGGDRKDFKKSASLIKQEVVASDEEEMRDDMDNESVWSEKSGSYHSQSKDTSASSHFSLSDKSAELTKSSSASALKISPSLFGRRSAKAADLSVSPTPPGLADVPEPHGDPSIPSSSTSEHRSAVASSSQDLRQPPESGEQETTAQFQCQVCNYTSTDKSTLLRHMRTHSGERPYKCAVCDYSFTTKANCERHLRKTHGLEREQMAGKITYNQYSITSTSIGATPPTDDKGSSPGPSPQSAARSSSAAPEAGSRCPACQVNFFTPRGLHKHLQASPRCRMGYLCLMCKVTFSSRKDLISHMSSQHPSIPAQEYNRLTASLESAQGGGDSALVTPPPAHAHSKPKTLSPASSSTPAATALLRQSPQQQQTPASDFLSLPLPGVSSHRGGRSPLALVSALGQTGLADCDDQPLDFSSTGQSSIQPALPSSASSQRRRQRKKRGFSSHPGHSSSDEGEYDDLAMSTDEAEGPIDLSMTRSPRRQATPEVKAVTAASGQALRPEQSSPHVDRNKLAKGALLQVAQELARSPHTSHTDSTNHRLLAVSPSRASAEVSQPQSHFPFSRSQQRAGLHPAVIESAQLQSQGATASQKHLVYPQFMTLLTSPLLQGIPAPTAADGTSPVLTGLQMIARGGREDSPLSTLQPGNLTLSSSSANAASAASRAASRSRASAEASARTEAKVTPGSGSNGLKDTQRESHQTKGDRDAPKGSHSPAPGKTISGKGSSSESDSSCDLASVNKILDATDAQRFQSFLMVGQQDEEPGYRSESIESEEDSNTSLENMYSKSLSLNGSQVNRSRLKDITTGTRANNKEPGATPAAVSSETTTNNNNNNMSEEEEDESKAHPPVTVNVALLDPVVFPKDVYKGTKLDLHVNKKTHKTEVSDPSNMSEQAIAELIEKVSRENVCSPAKKKRNSYADSPHKFSCPYCSRCFPWLSSLNRHLLTHTGQKPFKCPRCPVTFSTKSNRERHLVRKHNMNIMIDSNSRLTMDRPYKCHVCPSSSFSVQCNLLRHYKDRHPGLTPPPQTEDTPTSDGEAEDIISYEDEEEYNSLAEQASLRGLSDRDIMLQNYCQDSDSNSNTASAATNSNNNSSNSSSNGTHKPVLYDTHKKRNAVFTLDSDGSDGGEKLTINGVNSGIGGHREGGTGGGLAIFCSGGSKSGSSTRPGIDDTVLTDTMKNFLDKSVRQALEDSHRRAMEEGSKFVITPAIERHLRCLPGGGGGDDSVSGLDAPERAREEATQCVHCDREFSNSKLLAAHINHDHDLDLPYRCHLCDEAFCSRLECLQHFAHAHSNQWEEISVRNSIGNLQVFATRLDKLIKKVSKRQNGLRSTPEEREDAPGSDHKEKVTDNAEGDDTSDKADNNNNNNDDEENGIASTSVLGGSSATEDQKELENETAEDNSTCVQAVKCQDGGAKVEGDTGQAESCTEDGSDKIADEKTCDDDDEEDGADAGMLPEVNTSNYLRRKFHCSVCPKRYWSMVDLRRHMRSHTGERPHECPVCGRRFSLKNSLGRHMAKHCVEPKAQLTPSRGSTPASAPAESEGNIGTADGDGKGQDETGDQGDSHDGLDELHAVQDKTAKCGEKQVESSSNTQQQQRQTSKKIRMDLSGETPAAAQRQRESESGSGSDEDILHDLLGVESSTIDQIFEGCDSAASLLGV